MDIKRTDIVRKKRLERLRILLLAGLGTACAAYFLTLRNSGLPELDRRTAYFGTVSQGDMLRKVRGPGNLAAKDIRWLTARSAGRVDRVLVEAGEAVTADTLLLTLDNPEIVQQAREALLDLKAAEAEHQALIARLENDRLTQQASLAQVEADLEQALFRYQAESSLEGSSAVSALALNESRLRSKQLQIRRDIEHIRRQALPGLQQAQLAASSASLEMLRERLALRRELEAALSIQAGIDGVVQELPVEQGQQLAVGAVLARVADPVNLKAELRISEVMARDVAMHQQVSVDTRNGLVRGRVSRIDPSVENGTVTVDVSFLDALPSTARLAQSVDAVIEIEHLSNVVHVDRPSGAQTGGKASVFVLAEDGDIASRRAVRFGRGSVNLIEIVHGLQVGEQVILSDTSNFAEHSQIALN